MATLSEGMEYANRLRALVREAESAGYYLYVDGSDLDLRDEEMDTYISTVATVEVY